MPDENSSTYQLSVSLLFFRPHGRFLTTVGHVSARVHSINSAMESSRVPYIGDAMQPSLDFRRACPAGISCTSHTTVQQYWCVCCTIISTASCCPVRSEGKTQKRCLAVVSAAGRCRRLLYIFLRRVPFELWVCGGGVGGDI